MIGTSSGRLQKLTAEQKCDIATRELDELHEEIERKKDDWEKQLDCHQAVIEEAKQRMDEIKKHQYEFERDVCRGGVDTVSTFTTLCLLRSCLFISHCCLPLAANW